MDPKRKAITVAVTGSALGALGLGLIAMPAGAGSAPQLAPIGAEELVQSVLTAPKTAFDGTVEVRNDLGLPALPGMNALDFDSAQVFSDGADNGKVLVNKGSSVQTIVRNGGTVWSYNSGTREATKVTLPADADRKPDASSADPTQFATAALGKIRETSTVTVEGTARVGDRSAYELVLTPKPTERTVLREARIAVDAQTRMPLRMELLTNGSMDPAFEIGFSSFEVAAQPANTFAFTPPPGAKVTDGKAGERPQGAPQRPAGNIDPQITMVGDGWDTVFTGKIPAEVTQQAGKQGMDVTALLDRFGKRVSGAYGSGHLISTRVGSALVTDDGRFAAGAVPEQVLAETLSAK